MAEKDRLMHALFEHPEREHLNIKFFRGNAEDITVEDLAREAANGIEEIMTGSVQPVGNLDDGLRQERPVADLIASL